MLKAIKTVSQGQGLDRADGTKQRDKARGRAANDWFGQHSGIAFSIGAASGRFDSSHLHSFFT
jgi:hypothetical protein